MSTELLTPIEVAQLLAVSPVLGAMSDRTGARKPYLLVFTALSIVPPCVFCQVDARLSRRFAFGSGFAFEAMVDVFNLLDRVNYTEINAIFGRGAYPGTPQTDAQGRVTYGVYEQALPGRQFQLGAKITF